MDKLRMVGGNPLKGEVVIAGAKNAALPILCACLLTDQPVMLRNVPDLQDVRTMLKLLQEIGVTVNFPNASDRSHLVLNSAVIKSSEATYEMVKTMRASILVLGPLLARMHSAKVSLPGGCAIGARPVDQHIKGLKAMGASIKIKSGYIQAETKPQTDWIKASMQGRPKAVSFRTSEYPAFPTDMQAQLMAVNALAGGSSMITETIFENRFMHVQELNRLGADIAIEGNTAIAQGVEKLSGAIVMATDLRASASLVIAGLAAQGETRVDRIYHLDRGYDRMEHKLTLLGAKIERIK